MVGMFNTALRNFAASRANIVYIDMRPKMTATDWNTDEIHPKATGATKIAAAFAAPSTQMRWWDRLALAAAV